MPYARIYSEHEVRGMLKIFQGNQAIRHIDPVTHQVQRADNPAHPNFHAGASFLDQRQRVNTPGQPRLTGTYWNEDDQVKATTALLNSPAGQAQLQQFDHGETRVGFQAPLPPNTYKISAAHDSSDLGGLPGHVGRHNAGRVGAGSTRQIGYATQGFVLLLKGVGGLLQIQTSYPVL